MHREYVWISLKCCMRNTRNQHAKLATCCIFSPRTQVTPAVLSQMLSAVIQWSQHRGVPISPGDCCLNLDLPETADTRESTRMPMIERKGPVWFLKPCLRLCLSICCHHIFPYARFPNFHRQHISYWASVIHNTYCACIHLRNRFISFSRTCASPPERCKILLFWRNYQKCTQTVNSCVSLTLQKRTVRSKRQGNDAAVGGGFAPVSPALGLPIEGNSFTSNDEMEE